ncbi:MAG: S-layer homology domain-containing protein [Chloroflexi bacterium]|nr:S-layer homology domain-containing protein [Chloroflexota bacterium]
MEPCDTQGRPYFRPANNVTRGEVAKIVVLAESWILANPANNRFADVPPGSTFYPYVETAAQHGLLSGYPCGGALEPCDTQGRPYFRLNNSATRGQLAKIIYTAVTGY